MSNYYNQPVAPSHSLCIANKYLTAEAARILVDCQEALLKLGLEPVLIVSVSQAPVVASEAPVRSVRSGGDTSE